MQWESIDTSARPVRTHGHSLIILLSGLKMASSEQQGDFLDIVQGYLDRGEIFKPVEEFVTKLTLCKRCIGGARQKDVLKVTLSRMASLVKDKLATQRNKKNLQGWLKTVAKDLDTFQIVSRDWISEHIWKLPELPKPRQEEEYDPMKGWRDIRYYPSTAANEAALLELTAHEEMETELDYVDEDKLLASSPCKSTVTVESPRRSPRIQQRLQSTPTTRAAIVSPRRSPRSSKVQPLQDPSRKVSLIHSHIPSATLAVTCSPARKSRRDESTGPARGGHLKRKPSADGRQALRDTRVKSARSEDSSARRQQKGRRACSSLSSAAFTSVDRVVTVHHQPRIQQSDASSHTKDLIISQSFLKQAKTDDIIQSVQQKVKERRHPEVKKLKKRIVRCWVPGCTGDARYLKAHACYDHIPAIFDERLEPSDERVLCCRRNALKQAGRWLMGRPVELDELVAFVTVQKLLSITDNSEITQRQEAAMQEFCKFLCEPIPDQFVLEPCNSVGALLHWKALLLVAASLTEEERDYWRENFKAPSDTELQKQQIVQQRVIPEAFDSHFHLDRTLRDMFLPADGTVDDILQQAPVDDDKRISLVGAIAIYCDPDTYPTERFLDRMPEHIGVGIGFHPRHARNSRSSIDEGVRQLRRLLRHPRVIAFGEVGLDHTEPLKYWAYQVELLEKVLPYLEDRHVLLIHCRGMIGDCGTEAFLLLLHFLK